MVIMVVNNMINNKQVSVLGSISRVQTLRGQLVKPKGNDSRIKSQNVVIIYHVAHVIILILEKQGDPKRKGMLTTLKGSLQCKVMSLSVSIPLLD